jgi:type IV pilus assembly protein PilO
MSFVDDFKNLNPEDPGSWPVAAKGIFALVVVVLILVMGYFLKFKNQQQALVGLQKQEAGLRTEFETKQQKAANLEAHETQLAEMQEILRSLLRQLPSKTEIPDLLQDISQTAIATGIKIERFEPKAENVKEFYAEKPISLRMIGSYHQFGQFVSDVAALSRVVILTMHDIALKPVAPGDSELALEGEVRTYRYVDDSDAGGAG